MAEASKTREDLLRQEYLSQTARIPWSDLQVHYARGHLRSVRADADLVEVAVQVGMNNATALRQWIEQGVVTVVDDTQAMAWSDAGQSLWAVVAAPWVLVQDRG
ncbi:MAG: DUF2288 family protein [Halioglobus sp.]|nr:DUF2288 family protein [Halioglobus sp.]